MAEVINLSDDEVLEFEEITQSKHKRFKCLNSECRAEINLIKAPVNIRRFYGVLSYPKKTKVCGKCSAYAKVHSDALVESVRAGKLILSVAHNERRNTVVLTDSDSDLTDNEQESEDSEFEFDPSELYNVKTKSLDEIGIGDEYDENDPQERIRELIGNISDELGLKNQIEEGAKSVKIRLAAAEKGFQSLNDDYKKIESNLDTLRNNFYDSFKQDIKWLAPIEIGPPSMVVGLTDGLDVIAEQSICNLQKNLPPIGPLVRAELRMYDKVYSIKYSLFARWVEASIMSIEKREPTNKIYKICYVRSNSSEKILGRAITGRNLAYYQPCSTRIPVGTRIIARYKDEDQKPLEGGSFYVGIIAEIPTGANKYRYLIFFDDGYAQYVNHQDIRVVVESSQQPWEDVASDSREFIKDYLHTYPERPMVRLQKWNYVKTEWNGRWWKAQVLEVDGSLVKMYFPVDGRTEWIYRGSTRLSPLFNKKMNIQTKAEQSNKVIRRRTLPFNKTAPVVEYVNFGQEQEGEEVPVIPVEIPIEKRAVARKSTSGRPGTPPQEVQEQIYQESRGFIRKKPLKGIAVPKFTPHQCSSTCDLNVAAWEEIVSPLMKPILRNWRRQIAKERKRTVSRNIVSYVAPCGRRLRSVEEVFRFLRLTESDLEIDFFSFDLAIDPTNEWEPAKKNLFLADVSNGIEVIPITCVNSLDKNYPSELVYCNIRQPIENVNLNLDPDFLVHCNCTDDCQDKSRCECWQLTTEATKFLGLGDNADVGYKYRRLHEQVATGIYECNSLCSCRNTCLNRVVQHPIKQKLQLFKTARRGWGVRTLHDIPQGGFICVYVGKVLNEAVANQEGKMTTGGDDYYAELDFIEVVESMKEGYESEVEDDAENESSKSVAKIRISDVGTTENGPEAGVVEDDDEFSMSSTASVDKQPPEQREPSARLQARSKRVGSLNSSENNSRASSPDREMEDEENDQQQRQPQTFEPRRIVAPPKEHRTARELFGEDEKVYIMDAKVSGNIGRYFNHSCQPNVFVQNVFVDTHDVRFPWVAFFSSTRIRAGVELTWDYNYEVGSVPGKIKYCYCMAKKCRGRLL